MAAPQVAVVLRDDRPGDRRRGGDLSGRGTADDGPGVSFLGITGTSMLFGALAWACTAKVHPQQLRLPTAPRALPRLLRPAAALLGKTRSGRCTTLLP